MPTHICSKMFGVGSTPWSPLARGLLTRSLEKQKASKRGEVDKYVALGLRSRIHNINDNWSLLAGCRCMT